jgi:FkbM family methyltransferase
MIGQLASAINNLRIWRRRVGVWGYYVMPPNGDRFLNLCLHRFGLMGALQKRIYEKLLAPGMKVVDVGANQGLYTLLFSRLVGPAGHVYAFEPDASLFATLEDNCRHNQAANVTCYNYALGAGAETRELFHSRVNSGDNRLAASEKPGWFYKVVVQVTRADEPLAGKRVDFIKIDVQGWEFEVLKGMPELWKQNPDISLYFEFWPFGLRRAGCDPAELLRYLQSSGFRLYDAASDVFQPISEPGAFTDKFRGYQATNILAIHGTRTI